VVVEAFDLLRQEILRVVRQGQDPLDRIIGQKETKEQVLAALLSKHHIMIEGPPGVGKTTLAKQVAALLPPVKAVKDCRFHCDPEDPRCPNCRLRGESGEDLPIETIPGSQRFVRVQGSPELRAEDLLGDIDPVEAFRHGPLHPRAFTPGKLLRGNRGIIFFDELNRCPERVQNALLQVLEEGVATIGGYDVDFPADFVLIATSNPTETIGTERLSDTLLDRLDIVKMGYPTRDEERSIILKYGRRSSGVAVPEDTVSLIVDLARSTRDRSDVQKSASVRASIKLFENSQSVACLLGKPRVDADDVNRAIIMSFKGRVTPSPDSPFFNDVEGLLKNIIDSAMKER